MEITINEFEPDTVGTLISHLSELPLDMSIQDACGNWVCFRVQKDINTHKTFLEVS